MARSYARQTYSGKARCQVPLWIRPMDGRKDDMSHHFVLDASRRYAEVQFPRIFVLVLPMEMYAPPVRCNTYSGSPEARAGLSTLNL